MGLRQILGRLTAGAGSGDEHLKSEATLRLFVEQLPAAMAMFDREMRYLAASRRWAEDYRLDPERLIGRSHYEVFPELPETWREVHRRAMQGEVLSADDDAFVRADGSVQWLRWEVRPWFRGRADVGGVIIYSEDVTARKQVELQLYEQRDLLARTGEIAGVAGWTNDVASGRTVGTATLNTILGLPAGSRVDREELLRRCVERDRPLLQQRISELEETHGPAEAEIEISTPEGEARWLHVRAVPELSDGRLVRILGTLQDITDRRRTQADLSYASLRLRAIADQTLPDALYIHDDEGRFLEVNDRACRDLGYAREELLGTNILDLEVEVPRDEVLAAWRALQPGEARISRGRHRRKDGTTYPVDIHIGLMPDGDRRLYVSLVRDVTVMQLLEAALQASESRLRLAQRAARAGTWEWDLTTNENFWSDEAYRLYGLQPGSCTASYDRWLAQIHPDDREAAAAAVGAAARQGVDLATEWRVVPEDGPQRWLMARGQPQLDKDGKFERYLGIVLDITERKNAEESLRSSERRFQDIVEATADWVWEVDAGERYTYASAGVEKVLGYTPAEVIGRTPFDLMPEFERPRVKADFDAIVRQRRSFRDLDNVNLHKDGRLVHIQTNGMPILDDAGKLVGYRGLDRDVTETKRAEFALRESEARYRDLFEANPNPMFVFESETLRFTAVNETALLQYGYSRSEFLALTMHDLHPPGNVAAFLEAVAGGAGGVWRSGPERHRRKNGSELLVEIVAQPVSLFGTRAVVALASDVTEQVRAENEIRALNVELEQRVAERTAQLEQANLAKSGFLANMSHELRTPLNAIIGFSEMLTDGVLGDMPPTQSEYVRDILDAGTHLLSLINDILDLSKVEAGRLDLDLAAEDIAELLRSATVVVRDKALSQDVRVLVDVDEGVGSVRVDGRKLKQIVFNLLSNAVKFTSRGGSVILRARRCTRAGVGIDAGRPGRLYGAPAGDSEGFLEVSVSDTGAGIDEAEFGRLFEPFVQLGRSDTQPKHGTGLGLSLVRRLAELHGGTVGVSSRPGEGSRFVVWLPCEEAA